MSQLIWGILAILAGIMFCFRGYLAMRTVIGIWGSFVGFGLGASLVAAATQEPPLAGVFGWSAAIIGALLLGGLAYAFYAVAVVLSMGSVGYAIGAALAGWITAATWVHVLFGVAGAALLIAIAVVTNMPEVLLILVAASGGATAIIAGVLLLMGLLPISNIQVDSLARILAENWWVNVAYLVLFIAGVVTQLSRRSTANLRASYAR